MTINFLSANLNKLVFLVMVDYRPTGFFLGSFVFLLVLLFWRNLDISEILSHPSRQMSRVIFLGVVVVPLPLGMTFIFLNYFNLVKSHQIVVVLGPLLFLLGLAWLLKLIKQWKWLERHYQAWVLLESITALSVLSAMSIGVTLISSKQFDFSLLVGSWIRTI